MRTSEVFLLGAITGAVVVWFWGKEIEDYLGEGSRTVRTKAAEGIQGVGERIGKLVDRGGEAVQDATEHVSEALRAGPETIRPAPASGRV
jgi:gas vesicle protein